MLPEYTQCLPEMFARNVCHFFRNLFLNRKDSRKANKPARLRKQQIAPPPPKNQAPKNSPKSCTCCSFGNGPLLFVLYARYTALTKTSVNQTNWQMILDVDYNISLSLTFSLSPPGNLLKLGTGDLIQGRPGGRQRG